MMKSRARWMVLLAVPEVMSLLAQEPYRGSESAPIDTLRISLLQFDRTLTTYTWSGRLVYDADVSGSKIAFRQNIRSRLIRTGRDATQDEVGTQIALSSPLAGPWGIRATANSIVLADNRQLDLGNLSQHQVLIGPRYELTPSVALSVLGGYEFDSQQDVRDRGPAYLAELQAYNVHLEEFLMSFAGRSGRSILNPRTLRADSLMLNLLRDFGAGATNSLQVQYVANRREFYSNADTDVRKDYLTANNIFRRISREIGVSDTLLYEPEPEKRLLLYGGVLNRLIDRGYQYKSFSNPTGVTLDTRIQELRFSGGASLQLRLTERIGSTVSVSYDEREERHTVRDDPAVPDETFERQEQSASRLGNVARRTSMGLGLQVGVGQKDSLNFMGSASILRYDTPDALNHDDRDELLLVVGIEEQHQFSKSLSLSVLLDATLSHLVYLSGFQSANNSWNRVLRLKSRVACEPTGWLRTVNSAEVMANYTVYDFEEQISSVRSFSFRQASWTDSTVVRVSKRTEVILEGTVRLYERGILRWREFKERPENYFVEQSYWPQFRVMVVTGLKFGAGYRYFSQSRYRYEGRKRLFEQKLATAGPTASLSWSGTSGRSIRIEGWREQQSGSNGESRSFSNLTITVGMSL